MKVSSEEFKEWVKTLPNHPVKHKIVKVELDLDGIVDTVYVEDNKMPCFVDYFGLSKEDALNSFLEIFPNGDYRIVKA